MYTLATLAFSTLTHPLVPSIEANAVSFEATPGVPPGLPSFFLPSETPTVTMTHRPAFASREESSVPARPGSIDPVVTVPIGRSSSILGAPSSRRPDVAPPGIPPNSNSMAASPPPPGVVGPTSVSLLTAVTGLLSPVTTGLAASGGHPAWWPLTPISVTKDFSALVPGVSPSAGPPPVASPPPAVTSPPLSSSAARPPAASPPPISPSAASTSLPSVTPLGSLSTG
jgi:hypothetical protein